MAPLYHLAAQHGTIVAKDVCVFTRIDAGAPMRTVACGKFVSCFPVERRETPMWRVSDVDSFLRLNNITEDEAGRIRERAKKEAGSGEAFPVARLEEVITDQTLRDEFLRQMGCESDW